MRIILSPAKTMRREEVIEPVSVPVFLERAEELVRILKEVTPEERKRIWNCSAKLAEENEARLACMDLRGAVSPALFSYSGLAFANLSPESLSDGELAYLQNRLRILSGLYGILRPLDGIVPYRLEMGAKIHAGDAPDLYRYWKDLPAEELFRGDDTVINLASEEYSRLITPWAGSPRRMIHIIFAEYEDGARKTKGTFAKMARGQMTRWLAEEAVEDPEQIRQFQRGYRFEASESDDTHYCFIKQGKEKP